MISKTDVPWLAALLTVVGVVWLFLAIAAFNAGSIRGGLIVLGTPVVLFGIWRAVTKVMMRILYPNS